jgi:hypothetical protein
MECNSAEMAANYMNDLPYRTYGSNFVFGDGDNLQGRAVETTWHYSASFRDNDPEELKALYQGECYAIMMEDAVFRSDPAMDPQIRSVQTAANGPDGDPRTAGSYKNRYQGQADSIMVFKNAGIPIGHEEAEYISKSVAMEGSSLQVCVYANTDKELWVANSEITPGGDVIDACDGIYYYYDFSRFLPTVDISTNQGQYRVGDRMEVTLQLSNLGRASREDIFVYLEHNGNRYYLPDKTKDPKPLIKGKLFETGIQEQIVVFNETIPLFFPRGVSVWHVEAYEAGTGDLIDLGSEDILVKLLDEHSSLR